MFVFCRKINGPTKCSQRKWKTWQNHSILQTCKKKLSSQIATQWRSDTTVCDLTLRYALLVYACVIAISSHLANLTPIFFYFSVNFERYLKFWYTITHDVFNLLHLLVVFYIKTQLIMHS